MKNIITISIEFDFKGEKHTPSLTVELDDLILTINDLSHFYPLLAKENKYDLYSYEYEMMQAEPIIIKSAQGLVEQHIVEGQLNLDSFKIAFEKNKILLELQEIAKDTLKVENLQDHPDLESALFEAFQLGTNKLV